MKKIIGFIFTACICFSLCSCQIYKQTFDQAGEIFVSSIDQAQNIMSSAQEQANDIASSIYDSLINPSSESSSATEKHSTEQTASKEAETTTNEETTLSLEDTIESEFEDCIRKPLAEIMKKIEKYGYSATYLSQGVDFTDFIDMLADDYLTGDFKIDHKKQTIEVDLLLASNAALEEQESALQEKLDVFYAWLAVEEYGKNLYGSFELHYITGKLTASIEDENTWFLKATCTALGVDMMCEAKVTGTTNSPQVIYFDVY